MNIQKSMKKVNLEDWGNLSSLQTLGSNYENFPGWSKECQQVLRSAGASPGDECPACACLLGGWVVSCQQSREAGPDSLLPNGWWRRYWHLCQRGEKYREGQGGGGGAREHVPHRSEVLGRLEWEELASSQYLSLPIMKGNYFAQVV